MSRKKFVKNFISHELDDINEVKLMMFVVEPKLEMPVKLRIGSLGGRVLSVERARGISGRQVISLAEETAQFFILATARSEDAKNIMLAISIEYNFHLPNTGLAWIVDVEGYMGAKGILIE